MSLQKHTVLACGAAATWIAAGAHAGLITGDTPGDAPDLYGDFVVDLSGIVTRGNPLGDPSNPLMDLTDGVDQEGGIGPSARLAGIRWDLNYQTFVALSTADLRLRLSVNAGTEDEEYFVIAPAFGDGFVQEGAYASDGWIDLIALGMDMYVGENGAVRLEAYSGFDTEFGDMVFGDGSTLTLGMQIPSSGSGTVIAIAALLSTRKRR